MPAAGCASFWSQPHCFTTFVPSNRNLSPLPAVALPVASPLGGNVKTCRHSIGKKLNLWRAQSGVRAGRGGSVSGWGPKEAEGQGGRE